MNNVGKGSRQNRSVTSEKGLALRAESDGQEKEALRSMRKLELTEAFFGALWSVLEFAEALRWEAPAAPALLRQRWVSFDN